MIPVIIMGGILTGQFTPTEAGIIAVAYIVFVAIPLLNFRHLRNLPRDMAMTGLLYSIPLITIGAAYAFGWMLAYLRGPAVVSEWIVGTAGNDPVMIMLLLVAAVHYRRRFHRRGAGNHHLHAADERADQERRYQSGAHGRGALSRHLRSD